MASSAAIAADSGDETPTQAEAKEGHPGLEREVTLTRPPGGTWGMQLMNVYEDDVACFVNSVDPGSTCALRDPLVGHGTQITRVDGAVVDQLSDGVAALAGVRGDSVRVMFLNKQGKGFQNPLFSQTADTGGALSPGRRRRRRKRRCEGEGEGEPLKGEVSSSSMSSSSSSSSSSTVPATAAAGATAAGAATITTTSTSSKGEAQAAHSE